MTSAMPISPHNSDNCDPPPGKRGRPSEVDGAQQDEEMESDDELFARSGDEKDDKRQESKAPPRAGARKGQPMDHPVDRVAPHEAGEPRVLGPDAGRVPKTLTSPIKPSAEDVACHYCTHLPPRNWCPICNQARLKEDPHARVDDEQDDRKTGLPVVSMDYQEADTLDEAEKNVKTLVMKDEVSGAVVSYKLSKKGPSDEWLMRRIVKDLKEMGRTDIILKTDGEPALVAVQEAIQARRPGRTMLQNPPAYNPESNGACEKAVQDVGAQTRALKIGLESRLREPISDNSPIVEWMIPHAGYHQVPGRARRRGSI